MEGYLNAPGSGPKKCPLCRKPIEYEENPVNFEGGLFELARAPRLSLNSKS